MILSVMALGGMILGVTTIAGLLMIYQVRQATDAALSARAIFAADSGLEWGLYNYYCLSAPNNQKTPCPAQPPVFSNSVGNSAVGVAVTCFDAAENPTDCAAATSTVTVRSVGSAGEASRAFEINF